MALLTAQDATTFQSWGFPAELKKHRQAFIDTARAVHRALEPVCNPSAPQPADCEPSLAGALLATSYFTSILQGGGRKLARPSIYPIFARIVARYVLDSFWNEIVAL